MEGTNDALKWRIEAANTCFIATTIDKHQWKLPNFISTTINKHQK